MANKKTRLTLTGLQSVGLVDKGANADAQVLLFKSTHGASIAALDAAVPGASAAVRKVAETFSELGQHDTLRSAFWHMTEQLMGALHSINNDESITTSQKLEMMSESFTEFIEAARLAVNETLLKRGAKMSAARMKTLKAAMTALQSLLTEVEGDNMAKNEAPGFDLSSLPEEARAHCEALEKRATDAATKVADVEKANTELTERVEALEKADATEGDVLNGASVEVRKQFEDVQKRLEAAEAVAKAEKDARLTTEFVAKAAEMPGLTGTPEEIGPVLKAASEALSDEHFDALMGVLKAASEQLESSELFTAKGADGTPDANSAIDEINKRAAALVESGSAPSLAHAITKAAAADPKLYSRYVQELRSRA